ncbi:PAS domain S-box-containing protein [Arcticibacter tournemirensis]|uniref:histidine kinase n=1 Tax=Arcticibacter tournemirensis TaxID=699437 RepID=A0A5M9HIU4_9SPHI|nr:ATP-binding protein [Arcticibacter tournemirensis]KAA8485318.1 PAS domain S-box protein [Arcticibacter tournemirensis]TQM50397.1 PAS domain S-box-containing protein [Arcticibacter tournemirensis]
MWNYSFFDYTSKPTYLKYVTAFLLVAVVTVLKICLFSTVGGETPFLLYFAVIIFITRYYGSRPAIFASVLTSIAISYFSLSPQNGFRLSPNEALQIIVFLGECFFLASLSFLQDRASEKLDEHRRVFQILVEKSSDCIMMLKLDGEIVYNSPSVVGVTGYSAEDLLGKQLWSLLMPEEITNVKEKFYQIASHPEKSIQFLHQLKHKNGHVIWIDSTIINLMEEPLVKCLVLNFSNVTDRVVRERQMEDFIGIASHELKTPLTSLKAYTQVLEMRMKKENNATSTILVNKIDKQINRVMGMIFNLLDVTKLQSGIMNLNVSDFDFNDLVYEIVEGIQGSCDKHQIVTDLGPSAVIHGDRERIGQVVTNLISNAIKYSPDASSVSVTTAVEDSTLKIFVTDYGIGIPENEIRSVFGRFYRVQSVRESFQGLGLGLFISSQIVERHGGEMGVISKVNEGSTFWFSLPL